MTKRQKECMKSCEDGCLDFAKKHKFKVEFNCKNCENDTGVTDCRTVFLGKMLNSVSLILVFSHEAGHILTCREYNRKHSKPSIYEQEFAAWNKALLILREHFGYRLNQEDALHIRRCLENYRKDKSTF